jgi:rhodanese-related sulfurtransferase
VTPEQAFKDQETGAFLIDIRPAWQRAEQGEIPGSTVIERNHLEWRLDPGSGARLPWVTGYDHRIIVFCVEGFTSSLAAAALHDLGLTRATDMAGGYQAWVADGFPSAPAIAATATIAPGAVPAG